MRLAWLVAMTLATAASVGGCGDGDGSSDMDGGLPDGGDGGCTAFGGCCLDDSECVGAMGATQRCYGRDPSRCDLSSQGVCKAPPPRGSCWEDRDCLDGQSCVGASLCCACGAPEVMGTCEPERGAACELTAPEGCCYDDDDCASTSVCRPGVCDGEEAGTCVAPPTNDECWDDFDCPSGCVCEGAVRCPCGVNCIVPDEPGTCACT